jgi:hypothetical protein
MRDEDIELAREMAKAMTIEHFGAERAKELPNGIAAWIFDMACVAAVIANRRSK